MRKAMASDRVLVGTSRSLFLVDIETSEIERVESKYGLYYGISWDDEQIFVSARWYPWYMPTSHIERPRLLTFDGRMKRASIREFQVPAGGVHQLIHSGDTIFCTASAEDGVVISKGGKDEIWYPSKDPDDHGRDVHHFNSVWINGDRLFLVGHNNGPSEVWEFTYPDREFVRRTIVGKYVHNVWPYKGGLAVCNSGNGRLEALDGTQIVETGGFPRGVAIGPERTVVGVSARASRSNRWLTIGKLQVYDPDWKLMKTISLGVSGGVCEIRNVDCPDAAHIDRLAPIAR